jgi:hypothetical protein
MNEVLFQQKGAQWQPYMPTCYKYIKYLTQRKVNSAQSTGMPNQTSSNFFHQLSSILQKSKMHSMTGVLKIHLDFFSIHANTLMMLKKKLVSRWENLVSYD